MGSSSMWCEALDNFVMKMLTSTAKWKRHPATYRKSVQTYHVIIYTCPSETQGADGVLRNYHGDWIIGFSIP